MVREAIVACTVRMRDVLLRTGSSVLQPELESGDDVKDDRGQEDEAHRPEQGGLDPEEAGVAIDRLLPHEELEVAEHVPDDEEGEDDAGDGHDGLSADRG